MKCLPRYPLCGLVVPLLVLGSCSSGGGNSEREAQGAEVQDLTVLETRTSPAQVAFEVLDLPATLEFSYRLPGESEVPCEGLGENPRAFEPGEQVVPWEFDVEAGLGGLAARVEGIELLVRVGGEVVQSTVTGLGNDAPVVTDLHLEPGEHAGPVEVYLTVRDSTSDEVSVAVEFRRVEGPPEWTPVRPLGMNVSPEFLFENEIAEANGTAFQVTWDTEFDLPHLDESVWLRVRARDDLLEGEAFESEPFVVDNNLPPVASFEGGGGVDDAGGIPLGLLVEDEEGDEVSTIVQVRREGESFVDLPTDADSLLAIQADPLLRAQYGVAEARALLQELELEVVAPDQLRLVNAGPLERSVFSAGQGHIQILRDSRVPEDLEITTGTPSPLVAPAAGLLLGEECFVLEGSPTGSSLVAFDLETSQIEAALWSDSRAPRDLVRDSTDLDLVLVLVGGGSETWQLWRVSLTTGAGFQAYEGDLGNARAAVLIDPSRALVAVDDALVEVDLQMGLATPRVTGLAGPRDLFATGAKVLVSESGGGRMLAFDPDRGSLEVVFDLAGTPYTDPHTVLLDGAGTSLLLTATNAGQTALVQVPLDGSGYHEVGLYEPLADVCMGEDGTRWLLAEGGHLYAGGGVGVQRTVVSMDAGAGTLTLEAPTGLLPGERVRARFGSPQGAVVDGLARLLWDARDFAGETVTLRAAAFDADRGAFGPELLRSPRGPFVGGGAIELALPGMEAWFAIDHDGDGWRDVVASTTSDTWLVTQEAGAFGAPQAIAGVGATLLAVDLDLDGDGDLVEAALDEVRVHLQEGGGFVTQVLTFPGTARAAKVRDVDGDGDLDLLCLGDLQFAVALSDSGTFGAFTFTASGLVPLSELFVGAFDRGTVEVVLTDGAGHLETFERSGTDYVLKGTGTLAGPLLDLADVDGDGRADALVHVTGTGSPRLELFAGPLFAGPPFATLDGLASSAQPWSRAVDVTGDGLVDVLTRDGEELLLHKQHGTGFAPVHPVATGLSAIPLERPVAGDLDLEGRADLVLDTLGGARVLLRPGWSAIESNTVDLDCGAPPLGDGLHVLDLEGDGPLDLLSGGGSGTLWSQDSATRSFTSTTAGVFGDESVSVIGLDQDGDGDEDLVRIAGTSSGPVQLFERTDPLTFVPGPSFATNARALVRGDFDGDGHDEVIAGGFAFLWWIDPLNGATPVPGSDFEDALALQAMDLDGDGHLDLLVERSGVLSLWFGDGAGGLTRTELAWSGAAVAAGDWDGDGRPDLISAPSLLGGGGVLSIARQSGPRVFEDFEGLALDGPNQFGGGSVVDLPVQLLPRDVDGDGDLDFLIVNNGNSKSAPGGLTLVRQSHPGAATLHPVIRFGASEHIQRGEWIDLDRDGELDFAVRGGLAGCDLRVLWGLR